MGTAACEWTHPLPCPTLSADTLSNHKYTIGFFNHSSLSNIVEKCIVLSVPAPTPPQMFRITSVMARNLSFSWQVPMTLNGALVGYQLSCQPLLSGIPLPQTLNPGPTAVMAMLSNLYPGVGYNCSIVGRNSAGPSDPVYINGTTLETGTSVYVVCIPNLMLLCYHHKIGIISTHTK